MTGQLTSPATQPKTPRFIGRQLAIGFGSVSLLAIGMCAMLVSIIQEVSGLVDSMRHDESSIRQGMELSSAVREMSLHIAHTVIAGNESHLARYEQSRDRVRSRIQTLAARVPEGERYRLQLLGKTTQRMHALLQSVALPAARNGDLAGTREAYRELEQLESEAARQADALAAATTSQMAHAHDHATRSTRLGLLGGGLCALLIVVLSVVFTLRLRAVVLKPLSQLTDAALRYGRGDFAFRTDNVGRGELGAVADAFSRMADELASREARLVHNERMAAIGQLAAGVAHELNNPIAIIRGYLKTMSPQEDPETLRDELAILDEEAGHCQRLADDLLSYARADELALGELEMESFLEETARRYQVGAGSASVVVDAEALTIQADRARLRQVILNLLNNAGQVSPPGARVTLRGRRQTDGYLVEVCDRGPGIPDADKQRIFEPFFSTRKGGSGLGLAVCQGIVRAHGGSVEVKDAAEGGTVFGLHLPSHVLAGEAGSPQIADHVPPHSRQGSQGDEL